MYRSWRYKWNVNRIYELYFSNINILETRRGYLRRMKILEGTNLLIALRKASLNISAASCILYSKKEETQSNEPRN